MLNPTRALGSPRVVLLTVFAFKELSVLHGILGRDKLGTGHDLVEVPPLSHGVGYHSVAMLDKDGLVRILRLQWILVGSHSTLNLGMPVHLSPLHGVNVTRSLFKRVLRSSGSVHVAHLAATHIIDVGLIRHFLVHLAHSRVRRLSSQGHLLVRVNVLRRSVGKHLTVELVALFHSVVVLVTSLFSVVLLDLRRFTNVDALHVYLTRNTLARHSHDEMARHALASTRVGHIPTTLFLGHVDSLQVRVNHLLWDLLRPHHLSAGSLRRHHVLMPVDEILSHVFSWAFHVLMRLLNLQRAQAHGSILRPRARSKHLEALSGRLDHPRVVGHLPLVQQSGHHVDCRLQVVALPLGDKARLLLRVDLRVLLNTVGLFKHLLTNGQLSISS